jgi:hypothetical protein
VAVLRYGGGSLAQVTSSVIHYGEEQQLIFQCERPAFPRRGRWPLPSRSPTASGSPTPALSRANDYYAALPSVPHVRTRAD